MLVADVSARLVLQEMMHLFEAQLAPLLTTERQHATDHSTKQHQPPHVPLLLPPQQVMYRARAPSLTQSTPEVLKLCDSAIVDMLIHPCHSGAPHACNLFQVVKTFDM